MQLGAILTALGTICTGLGVIIKHAIEHFAKKRKERVDRIVQLELERDTTSAQLSEVGRLQERIGNLEKEKLKLEFDHDKLSSDLRTAVDDAAGSRKSLELMAKAMLDYQSSP